MQAGCGFPRKTVTGPGALFPYGRHDYCSACDKGGMSRYFESDLIEASIL